MNEARTLYHLQTLDLDVDTQTQELEDVEARMGETEELITARQQLDDVRRKLHDLQTAQRELEFEVDRLNAKIEHDEQRMFQGHVRNPRELEALRKDVANHKKSRTEVEDRILELMNEIEQTQSEVARGQEELTRIAAEWEEEQRALAERQTELQGRLAELHHARQAAAAATVPATLAIYEDLRRMKRGRAVARVERNTCQGCRISLPMTTVQHARLGRELVHCPSCGRVLFTER